MEKEYFLNNSHQKTGEYEVHAEDCRVLDKIIDKTSLGKHGDCHDALAKARDLQPRWDVDGCAICALPCHKK